MRDGLFQSSFSLIFSWDDGESMMKSRTLGKWWGHKEYHRKEIKWNVAWKEEVCKPMIKEMENKVMITQEVNEEK